METFAIYSVAKNHKNSFMNSINEIRNYVDRLENEYEIKFARVKKLSDEKKKNIDSLESKFRNYKLKYREPLITNNLDAIKEYAEELQSQIAISIPSLEENRKDEVLEDSLCISSEIAKVESINKYIDLVSKELIDLEEELSTIRIPEADSKEEVSFNFKDAKKKRKEESKEEVDVYPVILEKVEDVPSNLFKETDEALNGQNMQKLFKEDENINNDYVDVSFNNDGSLAEKVTAVYLSDGYWKQVYNYKDNKNIIDDIASKQGITPRDVVYSSTALNGMSIKFPTSVKNEDSLDNENVKTR